MLSTTARAGDISNVVCQPAQFFSIDASNVSRFRVPASAVPPVKSPRIFQVIVTSYESPLGRVIVYVPGFGFGA